MNTNELDWMRGMHKMDTLSPMERLSDDAVYTVTMSDLLRMPDVDFVDVAAMDPHVRALLN